MVKHVQNLLDQIILDCFAVLYRFKQSMPDQICHYILYGKDVMVLDDLNVLPKTNKYDKGCYILLSGLVFFNKAINLSKNQTNDLPFAL